MMKALVEVKNDINCSGGYVSVGQQFEFNCTACVDTAK